MRIIFSRLVLSSILFLSFTTKTNPSKIAFAFDADNVFLEKNKSKLAYEYAKLLALSPNKLQLCSLLLNTKFHNAVKGIQKETVYDKKGRKVTGAVYKIAYLAQKFKPLQQHLYKIIDIANEHLFVTGMDDLIRYLKDSGYCVYVATNKDRLSFDQTNTKLKLHKLFHGAIVHEPGYLPAYLKKKNGTYYAKPYISKTTSVTESKKGKPSKTYYKTLRNRINHQTKKMNLGKDLKIIFTDDKKENIVGATNAQCGLIPIHFNGNVLDFIKKLGQHGITLPKSLTTKIDQKIRYAGWLGSFYKYKDTLSTWVQSYVTSILGD